MIIKATRWILVLPVSFAAAVASHVAIQWMTSQDNPASYYLTRSSECVFLPIWIILAGVLVAPEFKKETAVAIAAIWFGSVALFVGLDWGQPDHGSLLWTIIRLGLSLLGSCGTAICYWHEHSSTKKSRSELYHSHFGNN